MKANTYGLRLLSYEVNNNQRTSLSLLGGEPITIGDQLSMKFRLSVRKAAIFGTIANIKLDNGKNIEFKFTPDGNGKTFSPTLLIGGKLYPVSYTLLSMHPVGDVPVTIILCPDKGTVDFCFGNKQRTIHTDLCGAKKVTISFGNQFSAGGSADVAPVDIWDLGIDRSGKPLYFWELRTHEGNNTFDKLEGAVATAANGHWLQDDHTKWKRVMVYKYPDEIQATYDRQRHLLYIVTDDSLITFSLTNHERRSIAVKGYRALRTSKFFYANEKDGRLYSYNFDRKDIFSMDPALGAWDNSEKVKSDATHINHAIATQGGDLFYAFGGYGLYRFHNELFKIDTYGRTIEQLKYSPLLPPRTSAAAAWVGNKLYVFGGIGNESGKQEMPQHFYYDFWEIDLNTLKAKLLWQEKPTTDDGFIVSSQMIYDAQEKAFYVATSKKTLLKLQTSKPGWQVVSEKLPVQMDFEVLNYSIYLDQALGKIVLIFAPTKDTKRHELQLFTIDLPLLPDAIEAMNAQQEQKGSGAWVWAIVLVVPIAVLLALGIMFWRKKKVNRLQAGQPQAETPAEAADPLTDEKQVAEEKPSVEEEPAQQEPEPEVPKYYDRNRSEIRMLGEFQVFSKDGEDITSQFTRRARNLLMILLLNSVTNEKGIDVRRLDRELYPDLSEDAARNNRNVYMRKLRLLLEKVGKVDIVNDKINYKAFIGDDVLFDFAEATKLMQTMDSGEDSTELTQRTLELLLRGPLLTSVSEEWLDDMKGNYSSRAITLLHQLATRSLRSGRGSMAYHICEAIMAHDPFNEEALMMQCRILCQRRTVGIAKNIYDRFCKTYEQAMGEPYGKTFAEVCKG